jgi:4-amino-4-deoxy-L-arabinose transferase-like glycosyltransferase
VTLAVIVLAAAALRFYGLAWGAPYGEFHWDEHFVFAGANALRVSMRAAAESTKFFMYGPLPMHLLNAVVWVHQHIRGPLDLTGFQDQVTYMVIGRAISAALGSATVLVAYFVGKRVSNRVGGLLAAALLATTVIHIAESHSFRVDLTMIFFLTVAWLFALRIVERGRWPDYLAAGVAVGAALGSKYSAAFILGVVAIAHLLAPNRPATWRDARGWLTWTLRGLSPLALSVMVFALVNPMAFIYRNKFQQDVYEQIVAPLSGTSRPIWMAQFSDVQPQAYWFTTNLWWSMGPALEMWGILGIAFLLWRRSRATLVAASFPLLYFLSAGGTVAPMARYTLPLTPAFAVAAGALSAFLLEQQRWRKAALVATFAVLSTTSLYAVAYMNVYGSPDARLEASNYLWRNVPRNSRILVEPSHTTPPTGSYWQNPQFQEYVLWDTQEQRDYYTLFSLDTYRFLYGSNHTPEQKSDYIQSRLALVDYILMDDFYVQLYQHLPESEHGVVKEYYRQLFNGELGFDLIQTFKVYPSVFGVTINDDGAELSSRMNDHPRVYIFKRRESK